MTLEEFKKLKLLEDCRVQMSFSNGSIVTAKLLNVSTDSDGSRHLIYDQVEVSGISHPSGMTDGYYADGEELLACIKLVD